MKFIKWKSLIITSIFCILPILLGVFLWDKLPESIAIHFNINNEPDNFASKGFAVFCLPLLMLFLQAFCCITNDFNSHKYGEHKKLETATKWIIPIMSIVLQTITLLYSLGRNIDIRKSVLIIIGLIFVVTGKYLPELDYIKNYDLEIKKARKINKFIGFGMVIMGLLAVLSVFLPPIASVLWLILLIPYTAISIIYAIKVSSKK